MVAQQSGNANQYVKTKAKPPFCWQHKPNLRFIRDAVKQNHIRRVDARNCIDAYRAITEFSSDQANGAAEFVAEGLARRLAGYAMMSPDTMFKALYMLRDLGVIRYESLRDDKQRIIGTFIELINLEELSTQTTSEASSWSQPEGSISQPFPKSEKPDSGISDSEKSTSEVELDVEVEVGVEEDTIQGGASSPELNGNGGKAQTQSQYPRLKDLPKLNARDRDYPDEFEDFWSVYPRNRAKGSAYKAWRSLVRKGEDPAHLHNAAKAWAEKCRLEGTDVEYIRHAASFLNSGDFEEWITEDGNPINVWANSRKSYPSVDLDSLKQTYLDYARQYKELRESDPERADRLKREGTDVAVQLENHGVDVQALKQEAGLG